ncbi:MAG: integrase, partial [Candidatus Delongbacteria bacterium]
LGFRVKHKKNYRRTTYSSKSNYPNLIKGLEVASPNVIWQSDITYIEVNNTFYYAVFIIDVYTKEIVGYKVSDHMRATANVEALKSAIKKFGVPQIHHSDRGSQYVYKPYIELLKSHETKISMSLIAQENAYAERINKTIKEEYLAGWAIDSFEHLKKCVKKAVK